MDRRQAVALAADLCRRQPGQPAGPLPAVAFLAPGGGGKTLLLDLIAARCQGVAPVARIDPEELPRGSRYPDLLVRISEQLGHFSSGQYRRLRFPRLELGIQIISTQLNRENPGAVRQGIRQILVERQRFMSLLKELTDVTDNWLISFPLVLLRRLLPRMNERRSGERLRRGTDALSWYRRHTDDLHLTSSAEGLDVLVRLHEWYQGQRGEHQRGAVERLLLGAFLADLRAAYEDGRGGERTVNPVVLVDDFDALLDGGDGERLLRDLASYRAAGPPDPLVLMVTSSRRLLEAAAPEQNPPFEERDETMTAVDPSEYARDVRNKWARANRSEPANPAGYLLPFWLHDFGLVDGVTYLARRLVDTGRLPEDDLTFLVDMHRHTHGHPRALAQLAETVERTVGEGLDVPDLVAAGHRPEDAGPLLEALLPARVVQTATGWLRLAAVPRRITAEALAVLLELPEAEARQRWSELLQQTFARLASRERSEIELHPLLRRLLLQHLEADTAADTEADPEADPDAYRAAHSKLAGHFRERVAAGDRAAVAEVVHHDLAVGRLEPAVEYVAEAIRSRDQLLDTLLDSAAEAPTGQLPHDLRAAATEALFLAKSRGEPADVARALLLNSLRAGRASTVDERIDRMYDLAESHRQLRRLWGTGGDDPAALFAAAADAVPAAGPPPLTAADLAVDRASTEPFEVRPPSRTGRRVRRGVLALALLGPLAAYTVVYFGVAADLCGRPGFVSVNRTVKASVLSRNIAARRAEDGECVGISDGRWTFDRITHEVAGPLKVRAAEAAAAGDRAAAGQLWKQASAADSSDAEALIHLENARVEALSRSEKLPVVTVVAFTTLTAYSESRTAIGGGRDELQGVYAAQREHNDEFRVPLVRVLIANAGGNYRYAAEVARQVVAASRDDASIVAVTGLSESRTETVAAIHTFAAAHIPMLSSTASSDALSGISPYFFRVAPPNRRQVEMGVRYAIEKLGAERAVLFKAVNDNYSESLAEDFVREFTGRYGKQLLATEAFDARDRNISNVILEKAGHACSFNPDLIYFTGRTDYMIRLLNSMNPCGDNSVKILGADELYQLITPPNSGYPPYAYNRLYFTGFAFPSMWPDAGLGRFTPGFYRAYPELFDPQRYHRTSPDYGYSAANGHVVLAYDAMLTLLTGIITAVRTTGRTRPEPAALRDALTQIRGQGAIQGASGRIEFAPDNDPSDKVIVMLKVDPHGDTELVPDGILGNLRK